MFEKFRRKYAFKFGKIEHKAGRLLGLLIAGDIALFYYLPEWLEYGLWATLACWITYLLSHTLEKLFFGNLGPRSGWGK